MNYIEKAKQKPAKHWGALVAYFSMDLTEPFWPALGFRPATDMAASRAALRDMISELRIEAGRNQDDLPDIREWLFGGSRLDWSTDEVKSFFELGIDFSSVHAENPHLSAWQIVMMYFPDGFEKTVEHIAGTPTGLETLEEIMKLRDSTIRVKAPQTLVDWDAQMCARHGWNPHQSEGFPPLDELHIAHGFHQTLSLLRFASETLPQDAQRQLWQDARDAVTQMGVWMPEPLLPLVLKV